MCIPGRLTYHISHLRYDFTQLVRVLRSVALWYPHTIRNGHSETSYVR
jgi:hypothetical protein